MVDDNRKRTIYLPEKIDKDMRLVAAERGSGYSEIAIEAFLDFLSKSKRRK
jgi:hypothetical protein